MKHISFDADRCVGCQICLLVCSGTWRKVFNPRKANLRVEQTEWYGQFRAHICLQKEDAECVTACPTGALYVDPIKGFVQFDRKKCDGCQICVNACPHDAIFVHPDDQQIYKCHLCGGGKVQQCVQACPVNALSLKETPS